jgi:hypothetical protein
MVTVTHRVGKLVAVRVQSPVTYREATMLKPRIETVLSRMTSPVMLVADLSDARVYSPDVAEKVISALLGPYDVLRRSGILINPSSALGGQIYSLLRETADPERQAWVRREEMVAHLSELLAPGEQQSLREFLDEMQMATALSA